MGIQLSYLRFPLVMAGAIICMAALSGCQMSQTVSSQRLIQHQAMVDPSGLKDLAVAESVKVHIAAPEKWDALPPKVSSLFTHSQWRSPSKMTGVGVAYVHLPFPLPAKAITWLAKKEYSKSAGDGQLVGEWEDSLGRPWFEAENSRYHVRGYCVTRGFEAWVIYCGYKREQPPSAAELGVAARSLETIIPTPFAQQVPQKSMANAAE
jgi:hypothetical protein